MIQSPPVTRREFVQRFMRDCGVTYAQAVRIYECMCHTFEDAIVSGSKVRIGRVACVNPVWQPPRDVHMHFKKVKGGKVERGIHRTFNMDGRFTYKFTLYKRFLNNHRLKWFLDMPGI